MAKIAFKWQQDSDHDELYKDVVELSDEEIVLKTHSDEVAEAVVISDPKDPFAFDRVTRIAVAFTLDNCIDQLIIMKAFIGEPLGEACYKLFEYKTLHERFLLTPEGRKRMKEKIYDKVQYTDWQKFQDDVCFACTTLRETSKEIEQTGLYTCLPRVLFSFSREEDDNRELKDTYDQKLNELKNLKEQLIKEKLDGERELKEATEEISYLKIAYEDALANARQELRYVVKWERARQHQNNRILAAQEDAYKNCIKQYVVKINEENRIHGEIENFILENTVDLQNAIHYWIKQYDDEIERHDAQVIQMRMQYEATCDDHIKLINLYEEQRIAIEEWLAYKEEKRRQEELRMLRMESALLIQRWWRTTLVIKKIGPYKPRRGKPKDKDKDKDKGKRKK